MRGWAWVMGLWLVGAAVGVGGAPEAGAWDLRIGTRTRLSSNVRVQGTRVSVDGTLRDNVGQGIPGMGISIDFERLRGSTGVIRRDVVTDRTGRYYVSLTLPAGDYKGTVHYTGQQFYFEGSEVELGALRTERGEVALELRHAAVGRRHWTVQGAVSAVSAGEPVEGLPLEVQVGEVPLKVETGGAGTASFAVDLAEAQGPWLELSARLVDTRDFQPVTTTGRIRVIDGPELTVGARAVRARLQRGLQVEGAFTDRFGGVGGQPVTLVVSSQGVETARLIATTEEDGGYAFFVADDQLPSGALTVEAMVTLARGESVVAPAAVVRFEKTDSGGLLWIIGGVLGLCLGVVAGFGVWDRLKRRRREVAQRPHRVSVASAREARLVAMDPAERPEGVGAAHSEGVAGVLWDGQADRALKGGTVAIHLDVGARVDVAGLGEPMQARVTDARGSFSFEAPEPGRYVLVGRSRGYVTATHRFVAPHKGKLAWVRFPLTPVRVVVRDLYSELVDDLCRQDAAWGRLTPRQVYRILVKAVERVVSGQLVGPGDEGLEAFRRSLAALLEATRGEREALSGPQLVETFTHVIEEVYFSQRLHDEQIIAIAERLAEAIRRMARDRGLPAVADPEDADA